MDALSALERKVIYIEATSVAEAIRSNLKVILLDSRSFMVYHTSHIHTAINIGGNRAFQRKFSQNKVSFDVFLCKLANYRNLVELQKIPIIVYDECVDSLSSLRPECFLFSLLAQLTSKFPVVFLLKGGFLGFQASFPELCWLNTEKVVGEDVAEYHQYDCHLEQILDDCLSHSTHTDTSASVPLRQAVCEPEILSTSANTATVVNPVCIPAAQSVSSNSASLEHGVLPLQIQQLNQPSTGLLRMLSSDSSVDNRTRSAIEVKVDSTGSTSPRPSPILPHLVLGSREDANSPTICKQYGITHIVNVSLEGGIPSHILKQNFYQIPVNDNYTDLMTPYFKDAFAFIDSAKTAHGRVLIHCSAGISRSPTLAIAYLMYSCRMKMREAYDVVKSGRNSVAPNFNFLGQLLEFEHHLHDSGCSEASIDSTPTFGSPSSLCSSVSYVPTESSSLHVPKSGSCSSPFSLGLTPTSPKILSKKRDRPTYLGLETVSSSLGGFLERPVRKSSLHCAGLIRPIPESGISPTEGKRSRVSALLSPTRSPSTLLPSPCTGLSKLEISSPLEEYRSLLSVSRAPSSNAPGSVLPGPESTEQMLKFRSFLSSSTSLQTLKFEPCSSVLPPHPVKLMTAFSSASILRLRRSSSTVATIRPTLLAHRRLSSHASAPPTPRPVSVEGNHAVYHSILRPRGSFHLTSNLPTTDPSRVRELSPSNPVCQEPKLEYEQLQKCDVSFDVDHQDIMSIDVTTGCSSFLSDFLKSNVTTNFPHSNDTFTKSSSKNDKLKMNFSSPRCINPSNKNDSSQLSRSAPSQSDIDLMFCTDQANFSRHSFSARWSLSVRDELVSSYPSLTEPRKWDTTLTSTSVKPSAYARLRPQVIGTETSCRRQQQSIVQSSSSSSPSSSTSHNSTHGSSYGLFTIS
uniref:protein-tyrosine-phosphatase n=1 Tax=Trichobilharzia regenti TaxID=157069 RepID=A0AA85K861_TRIRE|nr:unnamed protein product [Trichobilharzia regenti]